MEDWKINNVFGRDGRLIRPFVVSCNTEADSYRRNSKGRCNDLAKSLLLLTSLLSETTGKPGSPPEC